MCEIEAKMSFLILYLPLAETDLGSERRRRRRTSRQRRDVLPKGSAHHVFLEVIGGLVMSDLGPFIVPAL